MLFAMDRKQAIAWLRSMGRDAKARDWGLGETIVVPFGEPALAQGIPIYPGAIYLYPTDSGAWNLRDFGVNEEETSYESLELAVHGAHEYVARRERALREAAAKAHPS
jgi:hypothetical protein